MNLISDVLVTFVNKICKILLSNVIILIFLLLQYLNKINVFSYLFSFFYKGCKRNLTEDDLYQYRKSHDSSQLGDELEIAWNKEKKKKKEPSLFKILMKVHGVELFFIYILSFIKDGVR